MQVTAIIQNNSLIIPNIDLSQFQQSANEYGLITLDVSILQTSATAENAEKNVRTIHETDEKLSVQQLLNAVSIKTDITATIEEMNESIARAYEHWEG